MKVRDVLNAIEHLAPATFAFSWDRVGLQVGNINAEVTTGVVCLDITQKEANRLEHGTVVVSHHPIIWDPLSTVSEHEYSGAVISELIRKKCALIAAHTNWDAAKGGVNDTLAERLGLKNIRPFGRGAEVTLAKLTCFVPKADLQRVIEAAKKAGAGDLGNYTECAFHADGIGQFRPNNTANPAVGTAGRLEQVEESRLEMIVPLDKISKVEMAVKSAHPYEEPAFDFTLLHPRQLQPVGRIGELSEPTRLRTFRDMVEQRLSVRAQAAGDPERLVTTIAVIGGAGGDEWKEAHLAEADVLLTGEFKHNVVVEATSAGLAIVEAGHFATEQPGMENLCALLAKQLPEVSWSVISPELGEGGMTW